MKGYCDVFSYALLEEMYCEALIITTENLNSNSIIDIGNSMNSFSEETCK